MGNKNLRFRISFSFSLSPEVDSIVLTLINIKMSAGLNILGHCLMGGKILLQLTDTRATRGIEAGHGFIAGQ